MKVYSFQIEVMWVFLATMFCLTAQDNEVVYTYSNSNPKKVFKEPSYHKRIRPPPRCGACEFFSSTILINQRALSMMLRAFFLQPAKTLATYPAIEVYYPESLL